MTLITAGRLKSTVQQGIRVDTEGAEEPYLRSVSVMFVYLVNIGHEVKPSTSGDDADADVLNVPLFLGELLHTKN